jgi:hypothetical protein
MDHMTKDAEQKMKERLHAGKKDDEVALDKHKYVDSANI